MRFDMPMARRVAILAAVSLALAAGATAGDKKGQARHNASETVDSSSLGVLLEGQRVATETFTVELQASTSTIKSQLQEASAAHSASQESNLEITANGQLLRSGEIRRQPASLKAAVSSANRNGEISVRCSSGPELSMPVCGERVEREKILVPGSDRDLMPLNLKGDDFDWAPLGQRPGSFEAHSSGDSCQSRRGTPGLDCSCPAAHARPPRKSSC